MNKITVVVGSVTYAIKLRRMLSRSGVEARQVKVDNFSGGVGCSHGVEIDERELYSVIFILRDLGVEYTLINSRDIS